MPDGDGLVALLVIALLATVLANVVNNLPATLLLVPLVAPLGVTAVLAALVGLGVGSGLTYTGSLANLLWRRTLIRHGGGVRTRLPPCPRSSRCRPWWWPWSCSGPGSRWSASPQRGQQLLLGEAQELLLVLVADLHQGDVGEAGLRERLDRLDDALEVGAARDRLGDVLGPDELARAGEPGGGRQVGVDLPAAAEPAELLVRALRPPRPRSGSQQIGICPIFARRRQRGAPRRRPTLRRRSALGLDRDQVVGQRGEAARSTGRPTTATPIGDRLLGQVPDPRGVDLEVLAARR